jgi:hypothetical protein
MAKQTIFGDQVLEYGGSIKAGTGHSITFTAPLNKYIDDLGTASTGFSSTVSKSATWAQTHLLVQQVNIQVQRPLTTLYDLTTVYAYYIAGRSQASMSLQKVVGPTAIVSVFYYKFGDVCQGVNNDILFDIVTEDCGEIYGIPDYVGFERQRTAAGTAVSPQIAQDAKRINVSHCILSQCSFAANVQNFQVNEDCQMQGMNAFVE